MFPTPAMKARVAGTSTAPAPTYDPVMSQPLIPGGAILTGAALAGFGGYLAFGLPGLLLAPIGGFVGLQLGK